MVISFSQVPVEYRSESKQQNITESVIMCGPATIAGPLALEQADSFEWTD